MGRKLLDVASQSEEVIRALSGHADYQDTIKKVYLLDSCTCGAWVFSSICKAPEGKAWWFGDGRKDSATLTEAWGGLEMISKSL